MLNVDQILRQLREERQLIENAIAQLERLASQSPPPRRPAKIKGNTISQDRAQVAGAGED